MTQSMSKNELSLNLSKLKGHMTIKSSALCTEPCKLGKQFLTAQHLASHYKRIVNVRSSIDSTPPKSLIQSQKARDRVKREKSLMNKSIKSRPSSVDPSARKEILYDSKSMDQFRRTDIDNNQFDLNRSISTMPRVNRMSIDSSLQTQLAERLFSELTNPTLRAMSKLVSGKTYDVLENHKQFFKQPVKEFEPRIKNRNAESTLKDKPYYNPPTKQKRLISNTHQKSSKQMDSGRSYSPFSDKSTEREEHVKDLVASSKPNIQRAARVPLAVSPTPKPKENLVKTAAEKEEELKYLNFIKEVTDDILARGVTTNRVIGNIFEYHVNKSKKSLKESKMRDLLSTLKQDLGIPCDENDNLDVNYSPSIAKATVFDNEKHQTRQKNVVPSDGYLILDKFDAKNSSSGAQQLSMNASFKDENKKETVKTLYDNDAYDNDDYETSKSITFVTENIISDKQPNEENKKSKNLNDEPCPRDIRAKPLESQIISKEDETCFVETSQEKSPTLKGEIEGIISNDHNFERDDDDPVGETQNFHQKSQSHVKSEKDYFNYDFDNENSEGDEEDDDFDRKTPNGIQRGRDLKSDFDNNNNNDSDEF